MHKPEKIETPESHFVSQEGKHVPEHLKDEAQVTKADGTPETKDELAVDVAHDNRLKEHAPDFLDICVHQDDCGAWVITPLSPAVPIVLRSPTKGDIPSDGHGVIWRLDRNVFRCRDSPPGNDVRGLAGDLKKRLKKNLKETDSIQARVAKLQEKILVFDEEKKRSCARTGAPGEGED